MMSSIGSSSSVPSIPTVEIPGEIFPNEDLAFERAVAAIVNQIELDMRSYGDIDDNPLDLKNVEFQIQTDRILKLLDMAIMKIEISFCLPIISKQWPRKDFDADQVEVLNIYDKLGKNGKWEKQPLFRCIKKAQGIYKDLVPDLIQQVLRRRDFVLSMQECAKCIGTNILPPSLVFQAYYGYYCSSDVVCIRSTQKQN